MNEKFIKRQAEEIKVLLKAHTLLYGNKSSEIFRAIEERLGKIVEEYEHTLKDTEKYSQQHCGDRNCPDHDKTLIFTREGGWICPSALKKESE